MDAAPQPNKKKRKKRKVQDLSNSEALSLVKGSSETSSKKMKQTRTALSTAHGPKVEKKRSRLKGPNKTLEGKKELKQKKKTQKKYTSSKTGTVYSWSLPLKSENQPNDLEGKKKRRKRKLTNKVRKTLEFKEGILKQRSFDKQQEEITVLAATNKKTKLSNGGEKNKSREKSDDNAVSDAEDTLRIRTDMNQSITAVHTKLRNVKHEDNLSLQMEPLLAAFPQGCVLSSVEEAGLYRPNDSRKLGHRLIMAENSRICLKGKNFGGSDKTSSKLCKYLILKLDHNSKEAILLNPSEPSQHPFIIKQHVSRLLGKGANNSNALAGLEEKISSYDRRKRLIQEFGSRKSKDSIKSSAINKVSPEQVISSSALAKALEENELVKAQTSNGDIGKRDEGSKMEIRRRLLPEFNLSAELPEDAYPLEKLMPIEWRQQIKQEVSKFWKEMKSKTVNFNVKDSNYVLQALEACRSLKTKKAAKRKIRCTIIILYYVRFIQCRLQHISLSTITTKLNLPIEIIRHFCSIFCEINVDEENQYIYTKYGRDKAVFFLLALCLHNENFRIESSTIDVIAGDARKTRKELLVYFKELGCSVGGKGKVDLSVSLTCPLKFPESSSRKQRPMRR